MLRHLVFLAIVMAAWPAHALTVVIDFEDQPLGPISSIATPYWEVKFDWWTVEEVGGSRVLLPLPPIAGYGPGPTFIRFMLRPGVVTVDVVNPSETSWLMYFYAISEGAEDTATYVPPVDGNPSLLALSSGSYDHFEFRNFAACHRSTTPEVPDPYCVEFADVPWAFDNLTFTVIPEPSSLGLGLVGLGLLLRRRLLTVSG